MDIASRGPVAVASLLWERNSSWVLTVICTATFDLVPGEAVLQSSPEPPIESDVPWEAPYARSLRAPTDLLPVKPNVDVLLTGHAHAPGGRPARSFVARLAVGSVDKSIEVFADRYFDPAGALVEGRPFVRMPLVYERAAGGPGTWNPAGVVVGQRDAYGNVALPNLLPPRTQVVSADRLFIAPVGFGPLRPDWPSRVEKLGRRSPRDLPARWGGQSVPDDLPREYFNAAPADQQIEDLREGESLTLENLHASHPNLSCRLPRIRPTATLEGRSAPAMITLRCDTLRIDTDRATCTLVWRGHVPLRSRQETGRVVVALDEPEHARRRPTFTSLERPLDETDASTATLDGTFVPPGGNAPAAALPFAPAAPSPPRPPAQSSPSWNAVAAAPPRSPLSQSASSWGTPAVAPQPSRASSPSVHDVPAASPGLPSSPVARAPLSQSAPSWSAQVPPSALSEPPSARPAAGSSRSGLEAPRDPAPPHVSSSPWAAADGAGAPRGLTVGAVAVAAAASAESVARKEGSSLGASGATLDALHWARPRDEPSRAAADLPSDARLSPGLGEDAALHLLWFDPESVPRIRRKPAFRDVIKLAEHMPFDPDLDDPAFASDPMALEERREVFEIVARAQAIDDAALRDVLAGAVRRDGKFVPPLALVEGELFLPFDELETLKATVAATTAFASNDERLKGALADAEAVLQKADMPISLAVLAVLMGRIRDAFASVKRPISSADLDAQTERALLSKRRYQRREVLGGVYLRALLSTSGAKDALPTYLPEGLAKQLPMAVRFRARLVAEAYFAVDQYETSPAALRALALGWLMSRGRR
ncbi:DUF2169 domain-containing protein [Sorangium sp. So ce429]